MKILQVGTGRWGANHMRVLRNLRVDLYIAELSENERQRCIKEGLPEDHVTADLNQFIEQVDAIDIVTPAHTHLPIALTAMTHHKDIFTEKPLAENALKAAEFVTAVNQNQVICQVGHIFRYDPATIYMKDAITAGELGPIRSITGSFSGFKRPRNDGGVTISDAIHFIDLFNFLMAEPPLQVMAQCHDLLGRGMDDMSWIWLSYGDTKALIEANYFSPEKKRLITIVGEKATLVCNFAAAQDKITIFNNQHVKDQETWKGISGEVTQKEILPSEPLLLELRDFIHCVQTRTQPRATAQAGAEAVQVVDAALRSYQKQKTITL